MGIEQLIFQRKLYLQKMNEIASKTNAIQTKEGLELEVPE